MVLHLTLWAFKVQLSPRTADVSSAARQCVCFYCVAAVLVDLRPRVLAWKKATVACSRSLRALLCVTCCQTDSRAARKIDGQPAVTRAPRLFFVCACACVLRHWIAAWVSRAKCKRCDLSWPPYLCAQVIRSLVKFLLSKCGFWTMIVFLLAQ